MAGRGPRPGRPVPREGTWPGLWEELLQARCVERPLLCGPPVGNLPQGSASELVPPSTRLTVPKVWRGEGRGRS